MSLQPRTLDIIVRKITKHHVYYDLTLTGEQEEWEIPHNSTFDTSTLVLDCRYRVDSNVILVKTKRTKKVGKKYFQTGKYELKERYDWAVAEPLPSYVKAQCLTRKQSKAAHEALRMELVDDGQLFNWNPVS